MIRKRTIVIAAHDVGGQGGMERHLEELITRLKNDMKVIVVACSMTLSDAQDITFIRIPAIARPFPLRIILYAIFASVRLLFVKRDLLHTTGAILFNRADFSTVHFCHDGYVKATGDSRSSGNHSLWRRLNNSLATGIALWMERLIYRPKRTKTLVAVSKRVRAELLDAFPYSPENIHTIPNGVDIHTFVPHHATEKSRLRKNFGLPENGRFLLFMGGDWSRKGLREAMEAFERIADEFADVYLLVVGAGEREKYNDFVSVRHRHRVYFTGKKPNPQDWMGVSDILIAPSSYETFSLVVHEAASSGLTVLTTRVGGVEDFIEHAMNGFYVEGNATDIACLLREILKDADIMRSCGLKAREKVESLTWDHTYQRFIGLYGQPGNALTTQQSEAGSNGIGRYHPESTKP